MDGNQFCFTSQSLCVLFFFFLCVFFSSLQFVGAFWCFAKKYFCFFIDVFLYFFFFGKKMYRIGISLNIEVEMFQKTPDWWVFQKPNSKSQWNSTQKMYPNRFKMQKKKIAEWKNLPNEKNWRKKITKRKKTAERRKCTKRNERATKI